MRLIQSHLLLERDPFEQPISFLFARSDFSIDRSAIDRLDFRIFRSIDKSEAEDVLPDFMSEIAAGAFGYPDYWPYEPHHEQLSWDQIRRLEIVIEQSPPNWEALGDVLGKATSISIGAFVGFAVTGGTGPLLLVTVPTGIILCGAAAGIGRGLEVGLAQRLKKAVRR